MNIRTSIAALAFCMASTVSMAQAPAATPAPVPAKPISTATKHVDTKKTHEMKCEKNQVVKNGKCEPKPSK